MGENGEPAQDGRKSHRLPFYLFNQQLRDLKDEVLLAKYVYDDFRRGILGFIDGEILHTLISQSVSAHGLSISHRPA